ncbi:TauD/TfdA family dioxygenase [Actinomadura roseirufa]|uniref:TauD/TfdA family dioxygenase n=1 Tax=Actinomadura roseirufa TaxID=2094049 RepID=UPI00104105A2|nr:TauD/TfdA family dioxygenase [Actinomadura roseirufa]
MGAADWAPREITVAGGQELKEFLAGADLGALLAHDKALVFRGLGATEETLPDVLDLLLPRRLAYVHGNSPRTKVGAGVYTSTEYPAEQTISMHSELSYAHSWPSRLSFFCAVPPATGGATPVLDTGRWLAELDDDLVAAFSGGVRYTQNLHGGTGLGKSWQDTFETGDRDEVAAFLDGTRAEHEWRRDGSLRVTQTRPATVRHPVTGAEVWFNQADQWHPAGLGEAGEALSRILAEEDMPQSVRFADGGPIPAEYIHQIRERGLACAVDVDWHAGDVLLIDNVLTAHGRRPFTGARRVLVAMS